MTSDIMTLLHYHRIHSKCCPRVMFILHVSKAAVLKFFLIRGSCKNVEFSYLMSLLHVGQLDCTPASTSLHVMSFKIQDGLEGFFL